MPQVSIIIPHFNRSVLLQQTINSVKAQTYTDWEIIIVDDGSDEIEWERLKTYEEEKIKIYQRTDGTKGPSRCRNIGVSKSKGTYLIFLDSDDLLADFCLGQRVGEIEKDNNTGMAVFLMEEFNDYPGDTKTCFNIDVPFPKLRGLFIQNRNPWNVTCPIWKRDFFEKTGGFDESFLFMEDPDLHLRVLNKAPGNIKICYDKPADCYYRINHIDNTKESFWYHSIFYRIQFYKKITSGAYANDFVISHQQDIRIGVYHLIRTFLYSRKKQFPELYTELIAWMKESRLFSTFEITKFRFLINTGNSASGILQKLRFRGICYKLLPVD
ncbi:MAG: glycosyltransferase [Bacteroidota bacterium]|nr:glycosyltransferase [Bacteroidota bacterium]